MMVIQANILRSLMYYGARYYSPEYRIFVQPDTLLPDPYNPQALNRYAMR